MYFCANALPTLDVGMCAIGQLLHVVRFDVSSPSSCKPLERQAQVVQCVAERLGPVWFEVSGTASRHAASSKLAIDRRAERHSPIVRQAMSQPTDAAVISAVGTLNA
jgi:hypothetical protein